MTINRNTVAQLLFMVVSWGLFFAVVLANAERHDLQRRVRELEAAAEASS